jgi:hypothetical protein
MAKIMERNINSIWILDTPLSLILSVCVATYCKTCLIFKKKKKKNLIFFLWNTGPLIWKIFCYAIYSRSTLIPINWDGEPSRYAKNVDNQFFFENRLHWQFEIWLLLFTVCTCVWTFRLFLIWSLEPITLYRTWSDNWWFHGKLVL